MRNRPGRAIVEQLTPGYRGETCKFEFRPRYMLEGEEARDWDDLFLSVREHGMINPLIVYNGHVLIGMRRWECLKVLGVKDCAVVNLIEPVGQWRLEDVRKFKRWLTESGVYKEI